MIFLSLDFIDISDFIIYRVLESVENNGRRKQEWKIKEFSTFNCLGRKKIKGTEK